MNHRRMYPLIWGMLILSTFSLKAEEPTGALSLPWSSFQELLKLNQDLVTLSWPEFQLLLKQTGSSPTPPYQLHEGKVILSREEFKRLLESMTPPADDPLNSTRFYLIQAHYSGRVDQHGAEIKGVIQINIPRSHSASSPQRWALFPESVALKEIRVDGQPALIDNDSGWTYVTFGRPGAHEVEVLFLNPQGLEKEPYQLSFSIPRTPITQLDLTLAAPSLDVTVPGASRVQVEHHAGATRVKAALPTTPQITLAWTGTVVEKDRGPAELHATQHTLLSVEDDVLRVTTQMTIDILRNSVNVLRLVKPEGYSLVNVQGTGVGAWKVEGRNDQVILLPLIKPTKDFFQFQIQLEKPLTEKSTTLEFEGLHLIGAKRESGFLGLETDSSAEITAREAAGLTRVDVQELPSALLALTPKPLLYGYKFISPAYRFTFTRLPQDTVPVVSTVIDNANGVSLLLKDGREVHQLSFSVRNRWQQYLALDLPDGAQVWSAFVDGKPVKPTRQDTGPLRLPLNRSAVTQGNFTPVQVELLYVLGGKKLGWSGQRGLRFPIPHVIVSQLMWSTYLPADQNYFGFGGDLERTLQKPLTSVSSQNSLQEDKNGLVGWLKAKASRLAPSVSLKKLSDTPENSVDENSKEIREAWERQRQQEGDFVGRFDAAQRSYAERSSIAGESGVLPIRIYVPTRGKIYRFSKELITTQNSLQLTFAYLDQEIVTAAWVFFWMTMAFWLYHRRERIRTAVRQTFQSLTHRFHKTENLSSLS